MTSDRRRSEGGRKTEKQDVKPVADVPEQLGEQATKVEENLPNRSTSFWGELRRLI